MAKRNPSNPKAAAKTTATAGRTGTGRKAAATTPAAAATATTVTTTPKDVLNATGLPRLGKGALEAQVLDHLRKHPKVEFTSTEVSRKLDRSNGAIQNALAKFAKQRTVVQTSDAPRRYRYAGAKPARRTTPTKKAG